jgi:hypothetical protein
VYIWVRVVLLTQHATRMRRIVSSFVGGGEVTEHKMCVLDVSTIFVQDEFSEVLP